MSIPESQLQTWTNQGSITNSASTHTVLRNVLAKHNWGSVIKYEDYLQGSYANFTNIRGESDVDIVVECTSIFYNNLTPDQKQRLGFTTATYNIDAFRNEVIKALVAYYGDKYVDASGANAIKVLPSDTTNRLYADVIVCARYKRYNAALEVISQGITFWNRENNKQTINYPKLHKSNGAAKNANTNEDYKKTIRMFKNARRYMTDGEPELKKKFPSYFVECLLYNVPNQHFHGATWQEVFCDITNYLTKVFQDDGVSKYTTQSGQHWLFGDSHVQWSKSNGQDFVLRLHDLWKNYYE